MKNFEGEEKEWKDWTFQFKVSAKTQSTIVVTAMEKAEKSAEELTVMQMGLDDEFLNVELDKVAHELYDILCMVTGGDALALVRSVADMDGIAAGPKLHLTYNPRTLARRVMNNMGVVTPPKISEAKHLVCQIERWEKLVKEMEAEYGEKVSNGMKMAILTSMMPANVQDIIFQQSNDQTKYKDMRDKVVALVMNRVTMQETPVPMDIGNAQMEDFDDQLDVDYAAKDIQCRRCDGWGHFARDCPSDPRKGKGGGKGHARAAGKSGGGSWQGAPKGDGKGKRRTLS